LRYLDFKPHVVPGVEGTVARRRKIRFTIAEDDFQLLLMLARTERKSIEDLFRESIPEVVSKYSYLTRFGKEKNLPRDSFRRRPR
jgi:hypothetical protein